MAGTGMPEYESAPM